ncbi:hypothetical protein GXB78_27595 [Pseudomonas moraviensis subsp. stanleyae]|uniref:hypothetical protein n=1 Tax=Pseudomonas moraviensis TaxID=321662 RepID=UPI002E31AE10|nr:hypothetical protein [Pseudomonas moraviensis]MED7670972.1 hypothetical protein [Pseudomonas moraviensis subsp. stanleyae]
MIVSFQGTRLSAGQRRTLENQERCKSAFLNPVLQASVEETLKKVEQRKEQGVKPEKLWTLDYQSEGTVSVAEWMGY